MVRDTQVAHRGVHLQSRDAGKGERKDERRRSGLEIDAHGHGERGRRVQSEIADRTHSHQVAVGKELGLTTLQYQKLGDLVEAIGLPKEKLCTYCWDGVE